MNATKSEGLTEEIIDLMTLQDSFDALSDGVAQAAETIRAILAIADKWAAETR